MVITKQIPASIAHALDLHVGDSFAVSAAHDDGTVTILQMVPDQARTERKQVEDALRMLRGAARLEHGETVDDARMAHYREKKLIQ